MAASRAFTFGLLPLARGRFSPARSAVRAFSCAAARSQLHRADGTSALTGKVDRFGGVTVNLGDIGLPADISESSFSRLLRGWWSFVRDTEGMLGGEAMLSSLH